MTYKVSSLDVLSFILTFCTEELRNHCHEIRMRACLGISSCPLRAGRTFSAASSFLYLPHKDKNVKDRRKAYVYRNNRTFLSYKHQISYIIGLNREAEAVVWP